MPYANNPGVRIHYQVMGIGSPLVPHHQALGNGKDWTNVDCAGVLILNRQLLLIDAQGHGKSDKPHDRTPTTCLYALRM